MEKRGKETFDDIIKGYYIIIKNGKDSLMLVLKIPGKRNIEINFAKQENDWTDEDYNLFIKKIFRMAETKSIL